VVVQLGRSLLLHQWYLSFKLTVRNVARWDASGWMLDLGARRRDIRPDGRLAVLCRLMA
jgi:hypothetical protein